MVVHIADAFLFLAVLGNQGDDGVFLPDTRDELISMQGFCSREHMPFPSASDWFWLSLDLLDYVALCQY